MEKQVQIVYEELQETDLSGDDKDLISKAKQVSEEAYAPYSKFRVGAAVELEDGLIVVGSNQENVAFPSGLCAERVALFAASSNFPNHKIRALAVYAHTESFELLDPVSPCGACRQVMAEYELKQEEPIMVLLAGKNSVIRLQSTLDLLPLLFKAQGLKL